MMLSCTRFNDAVPMTQAKMMTPRGSTRSLPTGYSVRVVCVCARERHKEQWERKNNEGGGGKGESRATQLYHSDLERFFSRPTSQRTKPEKMSSAESTMEAMMDREPCTKEEEHGAFRRTHKDE